MEVLDERVLAGFGIEAKYIRKVKYMYVVRCDSGSFVIRKADVGAERILFCADIKGGMKRKGFRRFFDFESTLEGKPYFELEGVSYIMNRAPRDAVCPDYGRESDFREIVRGTGAFHRAAVFGESEELDGFVGEDMTAAFSAYADRLKKMRRQVYRKRRLDDIDYIFLKNYEYYNRATEESLEGLERLGLKREERRACMDGQIIINNADEEAMALYPTGVHYTELLKMEVNTPLKDLRLIINRYLKKNRLPTMGIGEILDEYGRRRAFGGVQAELLYFMLMFPERYIKTYWDYYRKGRAFTPVYVKDAVKRLVDEKERDRDFIQGLKGLF